MLEGSLCLRAGCGLLRKLRGALRQPGHDPVKPSARMVRACALLWSTDVVQAA